MSWATFWQTVQKDEKWVVTEIAKGWALLQKEAHTVEVDVLGIFNWISAHHQQILDGFKATLETVAAVSSIIPQASPLVATATAAIDAATAAVDTLSKGIQQGPVPLSTIASAYHAVVDAGTAAAQVYKQATAKPAS